MALNLTNLFTALGRCGRNAYLINSGSQTLQAVPFNSLVGYAYLNPAWLTQLTMSYDAMIRQESVGMSIWQQTAGNILLGLVTAENPSYGGSLPAALSFLYNEMVAQAASVAECTIGSTVTADAANVGSGNLVVTTKRADGLILQNTVAETGTLLVTSDSYTGGATVGQEPWSWAGKRNVSSLNTGVGVGVFDWDYPQGSGSSVTGRCVAANAYANTAGNYLTNGDWATWTGSPAAASYWNLTVGTWGTSIAQEGTTKLGGSYAVVFNAGATLNALTQEFDSTDTSGTTAGTPAALTAYRSYMLNFYLRASGVISAGVLTVELVDDTGTVISDQAGTANSGTVTLSTVASGAWSGHGFTFRLPVNTPSTVRLRIRISTALAGANLYLDDVSFCQPSNLYPGGPSIALFSRPDDPFVAAPNPDGYSIAWTNNRAGASYLATWNAFMSRCFQTPGLILPYSGAPTIADSLIVGV